jgi:hypothetical protein
MLLQTNLGKEGFCGRAAPVNTAHSGWGEVKQFIRELVRGDVDGEI